MSPQAQVWTIGHSNRTLEEFIALLCACEIKILADVRRFPGSRRLPHFNSSTLASALAQHEIRYEHFPELGGRRKAHPNSHNAAWRNESFRGYADYMETPEFTAGIARLLTLAVAERTAIMCAEALWWQCHRALISDYLKAAGHLVWHIVSATKLEAHPYTSAARIEHGTLSYRIPSNEQLHFGLG